MRMTRHTLRELSNAIGEFTSELAADHLRRTVGKLLGLPAMKQRVRELEAKVEEHEAVLYGRRAAAERMERGEEGVVRYAAIRRDHIRVGRMKAGFRELATAELAMRSAWQESLIWSPQGEHIRSGAALVRVEECPPGTPAGPDPSRDEMQLAISIASRAS